MSRWLTFNADNVDIDVEMGSVNILLEQEYQGALYLEIPIADLKAMYMQIITEENL